MARRGLCYASPQPNAPLWVARHISRCSPLLRSRLVHFPFCGSSVGWPASSSGLPLDSYPPHYRQLQTRGGEGK